MSSIYLHSKHGLNPTMTTCYYCNEPSDILLVGAAVAKFKEAGLAEADGRMKMNIGVIDTRPCSKCEGYMKQGIILISVRDDQESVIKDANELREIPNPYRTGGWVVLKDEAVGRMLTGELLESILKKRMCFISDMVWYMLGLPRAEKKE